VFAQQPQSFDEVTPNGQSGTITSQGTVFADAQCVDVQ